jgi:hypothetical protein
MDGENRTEARRRGLLGPIVLIVPLLLLASGCGRAAGATHQGNGTVGRDLPAERGELSPASVAPPQSDGTTPTIPEPEASGGDQTADDLKTFAYGTTDTATLTEETAAIAATAERLASDAAARAVDAAEADAATLMEQAQRLQSDADAAAGRMKPLGPSDATLVMARSDALTAFALTAEYAGTCAALAAAAKALSTYS